LQNALKLKKDLEPSSSLHTQCNLSAFQVRAEQAAELLNQFPGTSQVKWDMELVMKGLSKKRSKERLVLNLEDL
jgi:hypothetical protein